MVRYLLCAVSLLAVSACVRRVEEPPAAPPPAPSGEKAPPPEASGKASYYGKSWNGRRTASGERFDHEQLTAAHRFYPFGTILEVTNPKNKKSVRVRVNDRGPFRKGRIIDLSAAAAKRLGLTEAGVGDVSIKVISLGSGGS